VEEKVSSELVEKEGTLEVKKAERAAVTLKKKTYNNQIKYSKEEELFNVISHGVGAIFASVAATLMLIRVIARAALGYYAFPSQAVFSIYLFSIGLIAIFLISALYHAQRFGSPQRAVFRRLDHCMIAIIIASSYAPFMLIGMLQSEFRSDIIWGIVIASLVIGMAVIVVVFNAINPQRFKHVNFAAYIIMGWMALIRIDRAFANLSLGGFLFLVAGGVAYTAGIFFFKKKSIKFNHGIWHLFVIVGACLHFASIYFFVL